LSDILASTSNIVSTYNFAQQKGIFYLKRFAKTQLRAQIDNDEIFLFDFYRFRMSDIR
jgi:aspartate/tyrosine/aromatic aminotransferase